MTGHEASSNPGIHAKMSPMTMIFRRDESLRLCEKSHGFFHTGEGSRRIPEDFFPSPKNRTKYAYDAEGRLLSISTLTDTWSFEYDALGNRVASTHNGVQTEYLIDPSGRVVAEYDGSGKLLAHYTQGAGLTSRVDASGQAAYYSFDATGNTAQLTGTSGTVLDSYTYLPFGESLTATQTVANPFTFSGQSGSTQEGGGLTSMARGRTTRHRDGLYNQIPSAWQVGATCMPMQGVTQSVFPIPPVMEEKVWVLGGSPRGNKCSKTPWPISLNGVLRRVQRNSSTLLCEPRWLTNCTQLMTQAVWISPTP